MACAPYNEVADTSFNISKLLISSGFNPATPELNKVERLPEVSSSALTDIKSSSTTPSTTHKGLLVPLIEEFPRMVNIGLAPKEPDTFVICTPETLPCSELVKSGVPFRIVSSALILLAEPVNILRLIF